MPGADISEANMNDSGLCEVIAESPNASSNATDATPEEFASFLVFMRFMCQRVLVPFVFSVGFVGNILSITILLHRRMRLSSTNNYLAALALVDFLYLLGVFFVTLKFYPSTNRNIINRLTPFIVPAVDTCSNTSVWLTVSFTIERWIAVTYPLKARLMCTVKRAQKVILGVFLGCLAATLPTFFEMEAHSCVDPTTNRTIVQQRYTQLHYSRYLPVYLWINVIFVILLPLTILIVFNTMLIRHLKSPWAGTGSCHQDGNSTPGSDSGGTQMRKHGANQSGHSEQRKITVMLVIVVIVFVMCQSPQAVSMAINSFADVEKMSAGRRNLYLGFNNLANLLVAINASINFILYCVLSKKFRATFKDLYRPRCLVDSQRRRSGLTTTTGTSSSRRASVTETTNASNWTRDNAMTMTDMHQQMALIQGNEKDL